MDSKWTVVFKIVSVGKNNFYGEFISKKDYKGNINNEIVGKTERGSISVFKANSNYKIFNITKVYTSPLYKALEGKSA